MNNLLNRLTETIIFLENYISNHNVPQLQDVLTKLKKKQLKLLVQELKEKELMNEQKMYLIELKLGEDKIRKYIVNSVMLEHLLNDNPNYEYVRIIEEVNLQNNSTQKTKKKTYNGGHNEH